MEDIVTYIDRSSIDRFLMENESGHEGEVKDHKGLPGQHLHIELVVEQVKPGSA
jgi:hypothetical protein